jgi:hexulose-6-phosphate isomerase
LIDNPVGIMQGRLLRPVEGRIQAFPREEWPGEFGIARQLGLDCIEFIFEGEDYNEHPLMNEEGTVTIERLMAETGIRVRSVCADYFMDHPVHRGSESSIGRSVKVLKQLICNCSLLGVRDIVIPCVDRSAITGEAEKELFVKSIKKSLYMAEGHGINLSLETDLPPDVLAELIEGFGSEYVKVNYDIGNSASLGFDPVEEISAYGRFVSDVHVKDRVLDGDTVPLGEGDADFRTVFDRLEEVRFSGPFILQAARKLSGEEVKTVGEYMGFVRNLINRGD